MALRGIWSIFLVLFPEHTVRFCAPSRSTPWPSPGSTYRHVLAASARLGTCGARLSTAEGVLFFRTSTQHSPLGSWGASLFFSDVGRFHCYAWTLDRAADLEAAAAFNFIWLRALWGVPARFMMVVVGLPQG